MFTGIIEARGRVEALAAGAAPRRLTVVTELDVAGLPVGASIAVDGVCLTVVTRGPGRFSADIGPETLARTTLGALTPGAIVQLERPLRLGDALGGHLVAGHVDGVGTVRASTLRGDALEMEIEAPVEVARYLVPKGSVAIDGVSLTVNRIEGTVFSVTLIPHTLAVTELGRRSPGARVNIEADLIAKQVERLVAARLDVERGAAAVPAGGLTLDALRRQGYVR